MTFDRSFAHDFDCRRLVALPLVLAIAALAPMGCKGKASGSGCTSYADGTVFEMDFDEEVGFDDLSSTGAALGIAVDTTGDFSALVITLRFSALTIEQTYEPTCNTNDAISTYDFGEINSVTDDVAGDHPLLASLLTDTDGIGAMQHTMTALLVTDDDDNGLRYFLAVDGLITLQRTLGVSSENQVTGSLNFVEITGPTAAADVVEGGDILLIDDIDFTWETSEQPT